MFLLTLRPPRCPCLSADGPGFVAAFARGEFARGQVARGKVVRGGVVRQPARIPRPHAPAGAQAFIAGAILGGPAFDPGITRKAGGTHAGGIGIEPPHGPRRGNRAPGHRTRPGMAGRSHASRAGHAVVAVAVGTPDMPVRDAGHGRDNPASARLLVQPGFTPAGQQLQRPLRARGGPAGSGDPALRRDNWLARRTKLAQAKP